MRRALLTLLPILALAAVAAAARADERPAPPAEYLQLQAWRYRAEPVTVPAGGLAWEMNGASWALESGKIWLAEPAANGAVTGMVFEGKGRFKMAVPDPVELAQLRRFAQRPDLQEIDEPFSTLVLRTSGELPLPASLTDLPPSDYKENKLARERHEHWLTQWLFDVDARIVAAFHTPGDRFVKASMKTAGFGWLTFDLDAQRLEETRLESFNAPYSYPEVWLSLNREPDPERAIDIEHVDVQADVTEPGRDEDFFKGRFHVGVRFKGNRAGATAVQLYIHPFAKVTAVTEDGKPVPFIQDHIGGRRGIIDNRVYDDSMVILLERPIVPGEPRTLEFQYELELTNYVHSRVWYPDGEGDETFLTDPHTARIELTARKKHTLRAMGTLEETPPLADGKSHGVWVIDHPVKMITFSFSEKFHEEHVKVEGAPEVICFGSMVEVSRRARFAEVAQDVAKSLAYFQKLFDSPLPPDPIYVTSIAATHGQAFEGFIHLAEQSFDLLGPGVAELFRAHEVAHQWWGHRVGAATYRDAWLGEAFAEYSAMLYVRDTLPDGPKVFDEILRAYNDEMTGSIKSGFSKFSRFNVNLANRAHGDRIGPIGHGWRANTGEVPTAYSSLVYAKGAMVLNMLAGLMKEATGSDQALLDVMRELLRDRRGGVISTADLAAAVARRAPGDWSWFFEEWVERAEIPAYRSSYTIAGNTVTLKIRQSEVPPGFRMAVPVRIELADGTAVERSVMVDQEEKAFDLTVEGKPKAVVFNPRYAVLAKMK